MKLKISAICALLLLTGCAPKTFIALPNEMKDEIKSTEAYQLDCQDSMHFDVKPSNVSSYTGGGLIFGLIDAAVVANRQDTAQKALVDIQKLLKNIDVQCQLNEKLQPLLQEAKWLNITKIHPVQDISENTMIRLINTTKGDATLAVNFLYKLSADFNSLQGYLYITVYPASSRLKGLTKTENAYSNPIFKTHVTANHVLENGHNDVEKNAKLWAVNDAFYLKDAIKTLIHRLTAELQAHLQNPEAIPTK